MSLSSRERWMKNFVSYNAISGFGIRDTLASQKKVEECSFFSVFWNNLCKVKYYLYLKPLIELIKNNIDLGNFLESFLIKKSIYLINTGPSNFLFFLVFVLEVLPFHLSCWICAVIYTFTVFVFLVGLVVRYPFILDIGNLCFLLVLFSEILFCFGRCVYVCMYGECS